MKGEAAAGKEPRGQVQGVLPGGREVRARAGQRELVPTRGGVQVPATDRGQDLARQERNGPRKQEPPGGHRESHRVPRVRHSEDIGRDKGAERKPPGK